MCILYDMTETQVDEMSVIDFNKKCRECAKFLSISEVPGEAKKKINGYWVNYEPQTLKHRQYVEINYWVNDFVENMHLILASIVMPVKWKFFKGVNKADEHSKYAEAMLSAKIVDVYHSCVFFCKLYSNLIGVTVDYLGSKNMLKGMNQQMITALKDDTVGFIAPQK